VSAGAKKNSSVLSCIVKKKEKAVTVAAKSGQFTAGETGKGQFLRGNRQEEKRACLICNDWGQWAGSMGKGECCSDFGERVRQFITRKSSVIGN